MVGAAAALDPTLITELACFSPFDMVGSTAFKAKALKGGKNLNTDWVYSFRGFHRQFPELLEVEFSGHEERQGRRHATPLSLLPCAAAMSVNAVENEILGAPVSDRPCRLPGESLKIDVNSYFQPAADSYLLHLNRVSFEAAVAEAVGETNGGT